MWITTTITTLRSTAGVSASRFYLERMYSALPSRKNNTLKICECDSVIVLAMNYYSEYNHNLNLPFSPRLHMLCDLEKAARCIVGIQRNSSSDDDESTQEYVSQSKLLARWDSRLNMAQYSFRTQEPILCLRRILLNLNEKWVITRKAGNKCKISLEYSHNTNFQKFLEVKKQNIHQDA